MIFQIPNDCCLMDNLILKLEIKKKEVIKWIKEKRNKDDEEYKRIEEEMKMILTYNEYYMMNDDAKFIFKGFREQNNTYFKTF